MARKVYIHWEGTSPVGPEFGWTSAFSFDASRSTVRDLLAEFCASFNKGNPECRPLIDDSMLELTTSLGKNITTMSGERLADTIEDESDFFIRLRAPSSSSPAGSATAQSPVGDLAAKAKCAADALAADKKQVKTFVAAKSYRKARLICERHVKDGYSDDLFFICTLLELVLATRSAKTRGINLFRAYNQRVKLEMKQSEGQGAMKSSITLNYLYARVLHEAFEFDDAIRVVDRTVKLSGREYAWVSNKFVDEKKPVPGLMMSSTKSTKSSSGSNEQLARKLDLITLKAEAVFDQGGHNEAVQIVNETMQFPIAESHLGVLCAYAYFASEYDKAEEAVRALLKAVTVDQKAKRVRKLMSKVLSTVSGVTQLMEQLPPGRLGAGARASSGSSSSSSSTADTSSVYSFLASICKDVSAMTACIKLYGVASEVANLSANYVLNLMHAHEIVGNYDAALKCMREYCRRNAVMRIFPASVADGGDNNSSNTTGVLKALLTVLDNVDSFGQFEAGSESTVQPYAMRWIDPTYGSDGQQALLIIAQADAADDNVIQPTIVSATVAASISAADSFRAGNTKDGQQQQQQKKKDVYSELQLDLLAMGFTAVKLLYLQGKLAALPHVFAIIDPLRRASGKQLHETLIRNEHAYYQCVAQILSARCREESMGGEAGPDRGSTAATSGTGLLLSGILTPAASAAALATAASAAACGPGSAVVGTVLAASTPSSSPSASQSPGDARRSPPLFDVYSKFATENPIFAEAAKNPLYVCGDSHSLAPGWRVLRVHGQYRLLVPKLVTGVKQWHLREESDFYPKEHFRCITNSIPNEAEVVLVIGEIDCREGMLQSVERDYHSSVEEAMRATLAAFMPVLRSLVKRKKFKIFVHPIVPVLNETRSIVLKYNAAYQKEIEALESPSIRWLDFFEGMVQDRAAAAAEGTADTSIALTSNSPLAQQLAAYADSSLCPDASTARSAMQKLLAGAGGMQLNRRYKLDGTHLHPDYVELIEGALNKL